MKQQENSIEKSGNEKSKKRSENYKADYFRDATYDEVYIRFFDNIKRSCYYKLKNETLAEDITQEAFLNLFHSWDHLRSHSFASIFSWLRTTSKNLVLKYFKKAENKFINISYETYVSENPDIPAEDGEIDISKLSYEEYIKVIKDFLSPEEFTLFYLFYIEKLRQKKIAELFNMNVGRIKYRIACIKNKLKRFLHDGPYYYFFL